MLRVKIILVILCLGITLSFIQGVLAQDLSTTLTLKSQPILEARVIVPPTPENHSRPQVPQTLPFNVGEKMIFSVSWSGIDAGEATLEVKEILPYEGHEVFRLLSNAKTNRLFSVFYKMHDTLESLLDAKSLVSRRYKKIERERDKESNKEFIFDQERNTVLYKGKTYYTLPNVQDELSLLYYVRTLDFQVGNSLYIDIFSGKKNWRVKANVLRKERVIVPAGTYNTIVVEPEIKFEGILEAGNMTLWFTDDERKMPIKLRSHIKVGSIEARLEKFQLAPTTAVVSDKGDGEEEGLEKTTPKNTNGSPANLENTNGEQK
jgi:hypothetical protein